MPTWPAELPQRLLRDGFNRSGADNRVEFEPELGTGMARRRGTSAPMPVTGAISVSKSQSDDFWAFYRDDLKSGSIPFTWVDPVNPANPAVFRFSGVPQEAPRAGGRMTISFQLLQLP